VKGYLPPTGMTADVFAALPVTLAVREIRYTVRQKRFRVQVVALVTTLLDPVAYPAEAQADLYRAMWRVESNLAHLKTTLGLDVLHCQSEAGVRREIAMFALAYSLVRVVDATLPTFDVNPDRRDRIEPRSQKRRTKKYPYMKNLRAELRKLRMAKEVAA
jgi:IS4 transposase